MEQKRYGKVTGKPIDIYKKEVEEKEPEKKQIDLKKRTDSLALSSLQKKTLALSQTHKVLAEKIETLNNTVRNQPTRKVAGIIHYWLKSGTKENERSPKSFFD